MLFSALLCYFQPMCDGSHKTVSSSTVFHSHKFQVDENKELMLCNCKQTNSRPFCDGSHKQQWIQDAVSVK